MGRLWRPPVRVLSRAWCYPSLPKLSLAPTNSDATGDKQTHGPHQSEAVSITDLLHHVRHPSVGLHASFFPSACSIVCLRSHWPSGYRPTMPQRLCGKARAVVAERVGYAAFAHNVYTTPSNERGTKVRCSESSSCRAMMAAMSGAKRARTNSSSGMCSLHPSQQQKNRLGRSQ